MKPLRPTADVSELPSVTFGPRSLMWWGSLGYMTIEGWTLAIIVGGYLYLRQNVHAWPPLRTPNPSLLIPSLNMAVMLASLFPAWMVSRAGKQLDDDGVRKWLAISSCVGIVIVVLRWFEFGALNTRWDTNAYGSAAWTIVGFHTSILFLDVCDTIGLTMFYFLRRMPVKGCSDAADNSFFWYFTILIWLPVYLIVYVGPSIF